MKVKRLDEGHPLQCYIDDTKALLDLLYEDISLLQCSDFDFLKEFYKKNKRFFELTDGCTSNSSSKDVFTTYSEHTATEKKNYVSSLHDLGGNGEMEHMEDIVEDVDDDQGEEEKTQDGNYWENDYNPHCYQFQTNAQDDKVDHSSQSSSPLSPDDDCTQTYEVVIIGAGAAGIGIAIALIAGGMKRSNLLILERHSVAYSFESWSPHTRFISPSFHSNPFGPIDLNSVDPFSSVSSTLQSINHVFNHGDSNNERTTDSGHESHDDYFYNEEHINGDMYAKYLKLNASKWKIPIQENKNVTHVKKIPPSKNWKHSAFEIETETTNGIKRKKEKNLIYTRFVIWCGGEFSYPMIPSNQKGEKSNNSTSFQASSFLHYSSLNFGKNSWRDFAQKVTEREKMEGRISIVIIGAFEAGVDTACALISLSTNVSVILVDSAKDVLGWTAKDGLNNETLNKETQSKHYNPDPSVSLSNLSLHRLQEAKKTGRLRFIQDSTCTGTSIFANNGYIAEIITNSTGEKKTVKGSLPIILCTGFDPKQSILGELVDWKTNLDHYSFKQEKEIQSTHEKEQQTSNVFDEFPLVSQECDESLKCPGVFLCGPMLRHFVSRNRAKVSHAGESCLHNFIPQKIETQIQNKITHENSREINEIIFCFIYKFRTRFALVASEILSRLVFEDHFDTKGISDESCQTILENSKPIQQTIDSLGHVRLSKVENMMSFYKEKGIFLSDLSCASCSASDACSKSGC